MSEITEKEIDGPPVEDDGNGGFGGLLNFMDVLENCHKWRFTKFERTLLYLRALAIAWAMIFVAYIILVLLFTGGYILVMGIKTLGNFEAKDFSDLFICSVLNLGPAVLFLLFVRLYPGLYEKRKRKS